MTGEGGPVTEISTNQITDTLPLSVPLSVLPKKKMKGREECELLEKVLTAFQVQFLKWVGNSSLNPEQA
jgi:ABC-type phosphate transport system substrate-binding protein